MTAIKPFQFGKDICAIFGLDPSKTQSITIKIIPDDLVIVEAKVILFEEDTTKIIEEMNTYQFKVIPTFDPSLPNLQQLHKCDDIAYRPWRQRLGLSLRQVAKATGVSPATISRMERGKECILSNVMKVHEYYAKNKK